MSIQEPSTNSNTAVSSKRVIIVDDSLTVRKVVNKTLYDENFLITECASGSEAIQELNKQYYDLIFLDYILPDTTAADFLDELLKNTHYANVPVILMSSKGAEIERLSEFNDNVISTLTKPFSQQLVLQATQAAFDGGLDAPLTQIIRTTQSPPNNRQTATHARVLLEKGLSRVAGHIPALEAKRKGSDARSYYLPYLLHPELLRSIENLEQQVSTENYNRLPDNSGPLNAETAFVLLQSLSHGKQTGRLEICGSSYTVSVYIHKGMVVGVGTVDSNAYVSALMQSGLSWMEAEHAHLKGMQAESGTPLILIEPQHFRACENITSLLRDTSEHLLSILLSNDSDYHFWDQQLSPDWAINNSLNLDVADFILRSLRRIRGWGSISREIGTLATRFCHKFHSVDNWFLPHLSSFEAVVLNFLQYDYSVTELASTLGEAPSRVAEAIHTLHKFGLLTKTELPEPEAITQDLYLKTSVLVISTNPALVDGAQAYADNNKLHIEFCSNTRDALNLAQQHAFSVAIDDGSSDDGHLFEASQKLQASMPDLTLIIAENDTESISPRELVRLQAYSYLEKPFRKSALKQAIDAAIEASNHRKLELVDDSDQLKSINDRMLARQQQLDELERMLQKREHELLHNEELFFEKCNRFEEERTRLEILQDEYAEY
ncbi:response regulator [Coraliomargarita akajimensis]|nr:response regulator [Coraliomargarita akajimensis]